MLDRVHSSESDFRDFVWKRPESKPWFELAGDLNSVGINILRAHSSPLNDPQYFTFSGLFVRAHQSFQASVILIENGMIGDARAILRSATETCIALQALAVDPPFVDRLVSAHYRNQRKFAKMILEAPEYRAAHSSAQIAEMQVIVDKVDKLDQNPATKTSDIKWEQVAAKHCPDLYQLVYRPLSSDGTHVTADSIQRYYIFDKNLRAEALNVAPNADGLVEALQFGCNAMLWALEAYSKLYPSDALTTQIQTLMRRFAGLPVTEIPRATYSRSKP